MSSRSCCSRGLLLQHHLAALFEHIILEETRERKKKDIFQSVIKRCMNTINGLTCLVVNVPRGVSDTKHYAQEHHSHM